jgi:hypothetical protein
MNAAPLLQIIVGGLLTFLGGFLATVLSDRSKQMRESRNLALAFRGELKAITQLIEQRQYVPILNEMIEDARKTGTPVVLKVLVRRSYFNVFEKNVDKLGTLVPPLPELIASFYTSANAILEDLDSFREGNVDRTLEMQIQALESLRDMFIHCLNLSGEAVQIIDRKYGKRMLT